MKLSELKRVPVGYLNTPLEPMENLTKLVGKGKLYVKRDDMTGLAFGGNKARKLDYLVAAALDGGYNALMTFGGVQTNHGRMTVAAAVKYGLKPILVLTGAKPDYCSGNLILDRMMGADVHFIDTSAFDGLPDAKEKSAAYLLPRPRRLWLRTKNRAFIHTMYRWAAAAWSVRPGTSTPYRKSCARWRSRASTPNTWCAATVRWAPSAGWWPAPSTSRRRLRLSASR